MFRTYLAIVVLFLLSMSVTAGHRYTGYPLLAANDRYLSLDKAVNKTKKRYGGRVLSAKKAQPRNLNKGYAEQDEYRIRMLTEDGQVRRYRVDPRSGEILPRNKKYQSNH